MLDSIKLKFELIAKIIFIFVFSSFINQSKLINIDNIINESFYQNDLNFSGFNTKFKILAMYYPQNHINKSDYTDEKYTKFFNNKNKVIKSNKLLIEQQVRLAKNHGIFGFGIVYNLINTTQFTEEIFDLFSGVEINNFPFFIILKDIEKYYQIEHNLIKNSGLIKKSLFIALNRIKNYFISENYIKIKGKHLLGIFNSSYLSQHIKFIRKIKKKKIIKGFESFFILSIFHGHINFERMKTTYSFFVFPSLKIWLENDLEKKYFYNYYHHYLTMSETADIKYISNFFTVNGCNPEKFYVIFKNYLNINFHIKNNLLLLNAWNNYEDNLYLEPNQEFGFSYLNYLSKAIFNIDDNILYDLEILKNKCKIAIQVHLFYEDLIKDIINKTNNIPVKFDLYISMVFPGTHLNLINYIKTFSKVNYFEILNVENKGRDVLPFLNQMKNKFKFYKYLCHLHTKKTKKDPMIGLLWRNYLYNNLLGNTKTISQILYDFENNNKLGFLFPETFFGIIKYFYQVTNENKKWMDFLVSKLFYKCEIGKQIIYPAGNMFWAKVAAIFQIFIYDLSEYFPHENNQTDNTIMHGIERIWLYLVKYNHYYYKIVFKYF